MKPPTRLSLHERLMLIALLPAAIIAALVTALAVHRSTRALDDALLQRGTAIVSFLAPAAEYGVISGNSVKLENLVGAVMGQREVRAAAIFNDQGALLVSRGRMNVLSPELLRSHDRAMVVEASAEILAMIAPVIREDVNIDDFLVDDGVAGAAPPREVGWVYVELDARPSTREKNRMIGATVGLVLAGLALTGLLARRLAGSVSAPVARLVVGVKRMAAGARDVELQEQATIGELSDLERGFNAMARSVSEVHQSLQARIDEATAQLTHQARHDPLTGLANRRAFEECLEESLAASRRAGDHGALCFVDLDRFKIVNDTCGHAAGDELLCRIAGILRLRVREQDVVCRIGGDEFALILRGCSRLDALRIAESLRESVGAERFSCEGREFSVGASIGLVCFSGKPCSSADVLMAADLACYEAKKNGRNRVVEHLVETAAADETVAAAGGEKGFELQAQTIVHLASRDRGGWLEVLLRVRDEQGELHPPGDFLDHIERDGEALELDILVAGRACAALAALQARSAKTRITLSLNLGRSSIVGAPVLLNRLQGFVRDHDLEPAQIVLELSQKLVDEYPDASRQLAAQAHEMGYRLALQQVDGGGIRHIAALRPDYAKVSLRMLIAAYGLEAGCNLAQALAGMLATLEVTTIASEVEDPLLVDVLRECGFDLVQGRAISPPVPIETWQVHAIPAGGDERARSV